MCVGEDIMLKICTVYFDGFYTPDYVSKLYRSLKRNSTIPFEFVCISDTDVEADVVLPYNHQSNIKVSNCLQQEFVLCPVKVILPSIYQIIPRVFGRGD